MKNSIRRTVIYSVAAAMLVAAPCVFAQPMRGYDGEGKGGEKRTARREKFAEELGLTPEQREAIKAQKEESKTKIKEVQEELRTSRKALHEELKKPETDRTAIDNIVYRMKEAQGELIDQRVNRFLAMKKILTPEQFHKMGEMKEAKKKEWGEKKGRGGF